MTLSFADITAGGMVKGEAQTVNLTTELSSLYFVLSSLYLSGSCGRRSTQSHSGIDRFPLQKPRTTKNKGQRTKYKTGGQARKRTASFDSQLLSLELVQSFRDVAIGNVNTIYLGKHVDSLGKIAHLLKRSCQLVTQRLILFLGMSRSFEAFLEPQDGCFR